MDPWIHWVRRLQHVSETGLAYATDHHDVKRYEEVARLAAEVAGQGSGLDTHGAGHPTPKVDVRGALVRDGKLLLVREVADGAWTFPGGWADLGEPPSRSAEREFREEAGIPVRAVKLIAVHDRDRHNFPPHEHHIFKLFFLVEETGEPHGEPDEEVARLAAEVAGQGSGLDTHGAGHPTPKVDVRGALVHDGKVLLVREVADGGWTLPGGWADIGEPPSRSAEREFREEAGIPVRAVKLIAVHDRDAHNFPPHEHHIFKLFFLVEETGEPHGEPDDEVDGVGWFGLDDLPPLSTGRTTRDQLELALVHAARPDLPADFD